MKKLLKKIGQFFKRLISGLSPVIKKAFNVAITITNAIKDFDTNSPLVADILTQIIPGDLDDRIKEKLRAALPKIVVELRLVDASLGLKDPNEIMLAAIKVINQLRDDYKGSFLDSLAKLIATVAADGKLDWDDAARIMKYWYEEEYKE